MGNNNYSPFLFLLKTFGRFVETCNLYKTHTNMFLILALIATVLCLILAMKLNVWCWPVGIIATIVYIIHSLDEQSYVSAIAQSVFLFQQVFGWYYWNKNKTKKPYFLEDKRFTYDMIIVCISVIFLTHILAVKTDIPQPAFIAVRYILSVFGIWYLAKKNIYGWVLFFICDFFNIVMCVQDRVFLGVGIFAALVVFDIKGLIMWSKKI